jgi:SAM-dependent methyltransferase
MKAPEPLSGIVDRSLNYGRHQVRRFLHQVAADATTTPGKGRRIVVDIGAGHGDDLLLARREMPDAGLHAIEAFPPYQAELRDRGITVHELNIERDPFPWEDESVDVVIANQILEHVKELFWILHQVTRVLRRGGSLLVGVPNLASLHNRVLLALGRQPTAIQNHSAHVRGYTKRDIIQLLEICFPRGFALRGFGGSNFYPFPPLVARPLAALLPGMAWAIFLLLRKERTYAGEFLAHPVRHELETNFYLGAGNDARGVVR